MKLLFWSLFLIAVHAEAQMGAVFGLGPDSMSMGTTSIQQGRTSPFNVYAAPANLGLIHDVKVSAGFEYMSADLKPYGTLVVNSKGTLGEFKSSGVLDGGGEIVGFAIPIGKERPLTLGAGFFLPSSSMIRVTGNPVNYPFYPIYTDTTRNLFYVVGAGYEFAKGWSAGVNVRSTAKSVVYYTIRSDSNVNYSASATEARSKSRLSYNVIYNNERVNPESPWSLGAMYRAKSAFESRLTADLAIAVPVEGVLTSMPMYVPSEYALYGSIRTGRFLFSLDATYVEWSGYQAPYGTGNINSYAVGDTQPKAGFHNIFVPKFGMEYRKPTEGHTLQSWAARLGYFYHPSPVPDQTEDSNFVDNDRHAITGGLSFGLRNPFRDEGTFDVDFFGQYNKLVDRVTKKNSATNVGAPGYTSGGRILVAGAAVTMGF